MKINRLFFISLFILMLATTTILFFRDRFLFFLHGYEKELLKITSVEAVKAHAQIYKSKILILVGGLILSIITLFFSRKLLSQNEYLIYEIIYGVCILIVIVFLINCFFLFFLPKRLM
jgi:hypothetical protein